MVEKEDIKEQPKVKEGITIRACIEFDKLIKDYKIKFNKKYHVEPSTFEVTRIIAEKIVNVGGIKV